jgi:hypothetical protein
MSLCAALGKLRVDGGEPGGDLGRDGVVRAGVEGGLLLHPGKVDERPVGGVGLGRPGVDLVECGAFVADAHEGAAEMETRIGSDGVDAVVAWADGQAVGGVEHVDGHAVGQRGAEIGEGEIGVLEEERRGHQPHRRMVEDEEGRYAACKEDGEEGKSADNTGVHAGLMLR